MRGFMAFLLTCAPMVASAQRDEDPEALERVEIHAEAQAESQAEAQAESDAETAEPEAEAAPDPSEEESEARPIGLVLVLGGDDAAAGARARAAVVERLDEDGLRALAEADVAMRVSPARVRACAATDCALSIGRAVGASMTVGITAWGGEAPTVTVTLVLGPDRSFTATEAVRNGAVEIAARDALVAAQAERRRALIVGGIVGSGTEQEAEEEDVNVPVIEDPVAAERPLEQLVLPTLLGAIGLVAVGVSVYAMIDEQCAVRGPVSGICLRGDGPNYGIGALLAVTGGLSIAGAILWLTLGGTPPEMGDIDVVIGPGGAAVRGSF